MEEGGRLARYAARVAATVVEVGMAVRGGEQGKAQGGGQRARGSHKEPTPTALPPPWQRTGRSSGSTPSRPPAPSSTSTRPPASPPACPPDRPRSLLAWPQLGEGERGAGRRSCRRPLYPPPPTSHPRLGLSPPPPPPLPTYISPPPTPSSRPRLGCSRSAPPHHRGWVGIAAAAERALPSPARRALRAAADRLEGGQGGDG